MKRSMFVWLFVFWGVLASCLRAGAQNRLSGKVGYLVVEDLDWRDSSQMPPLVKRNVREATLYFDAESTFFIERTEGIPLSGVKENIDSLAAPFMGMSQEELAMEYAENGPNDFFIEVEEEEIIAFRGDRYYESVSTLNEMSKVPFAYAEHRDSVKINWKVFPEEKQIGELLCRKAVGSLRGRTYVAWY
ncbi:hypothetical protein, partial [Thermonema rossianum]|uniref:hypothetical protein n=1 Tax=Thermonema rossianum TaxID=55505 RepID=UPI0005714243